MSEAARRQHWLQPIRLETARLVLREWDVRDVADIVEGLNDFEVSRWLAFVPFPYSAADAAKWIERCRGQVAQRVDRADFHFAIELKGQSKVIGGVGLDSVNRLQGVGRGGIWLSAKFQGQGYGTEAFAEKIRFAFEDLNLRRLENGFFKGNDASWRMQQRLGYRIEGVRRQGLRCMADGQFKDECITALLREEWQISQPDNRGAW